MQTNRDVLVLTGGASRGAVQVGMMQALAEHGVRPAGFVGTSVGALNATYLAGHDPVDGPDELAEHWLRLRSRDVFPGSHWGRPLHVLRHRTSLYRTEGLERLVDAWTTARRLEDLPVPVRVCTARLETGEAVYHDTGLLRSVLLASTALPSVFPPVVLPGDDGLAGTHVDGGIGDLVPLAGAAALAPTRVFLLDATVGPRNRPLRHPIDVLLAALSVSMRIRPRVDLAGVELVHLTAPDLDVRMHDFSRTAEHVRLGREHARAVLGGVRDLAV
ncbi:patatin-like phospholipase family protein [Nocardioides bruguierae]|uniref:Patatin-like phospholipase family protein n=1 Tax=Nocardioides bruguierae TaxID=2945102 RepID=A0A9X2IDW7_9ACTN|nr:patatin-like phospholipase family protein [Nocardioides bruguierae]MCM0620196.1 patatin-like phospholipase family protein [Nocardioides bruguierae]